MGVNKVEYGSNTLVDLTGDTVTPEALLRGITAHNAAGNQIVGTGSGESSQLLKDTVGWTGKNLLKNTATTQTINGVTFTVNADGSINANGTASAQCSFTILNTLTLKRGSYVMSGCPAGGSNTTYQLFMNIDNTEANMYREYGNGIDITVDTDTVVQYGVAIVIRSGATVNDLTFYPMLRYATIFDSTYEPYHESVEVIYEEEIHGVNLLKVNVASQTIDGITYTFNANNSVTLNGTSTRAYAQYHLAYRYIATFTGMVRLNGGLSANIHLYPWDLTRGARPYKDSSKTELQTDNQYNSNGDMLFYVEKGNNYSINPRVAENGTTVSNAIMYPMLRKAEIEDSTYRPYNYQAIQNQLNDNGVLGAKNLLPYPYYENGGASVTTKNGVTFTVNSDGSLTVNGTSTAIVDFAFTGVNQLSISERLIYSVGKAKDGRFNGFITQDSNTDIAVIGNDGSCEFQTNNPFRAHLIIYNNKTFNNDVFYPMLRLASDPDDTYQPSAMTNRELTKAVVHESGDYNAGQITYDNTGGIIPASNVQGAIDKLKNATLVGSYVTVSSFTTLCDAIAAKVASMKPYTIENMVVSCSATFSQMPLGGNFGVQVYKGNTNNYISAIFQGYHSCELKRLTYMSGEWVFKDIDASAKWIGSGTVEPTTTAQYYSVLGSGKIHEFLIAYGINNSGQPYGGGTVVLPNNAAAESVCCLPIYGNNSTTLRGVVSFWVSTVNTIAYSASTTGFLLKVYTR